MRPAADTDPFSFFYEPRDRVQAMLDAWRVSASSLLDVIARTEMVLTAPLAPLAPRVDVTARVVRCGPFSWLSWSDERTDAGTAAFVEDGAWVELHGLRTLSRFLAAQPFADVSTLDDGVLLELVTMLARSNAEIVLTDLAEVIFEAEQCANRDEIVRCFEPVHREAGALVFTAHFAEDEEMPPTIARVTVDKTTLAVSFTALCRGWTHSWSRRMMSDLF